MFIFLAQGLIFRSESRWQQIAKNYKKSESELSSYSCLYVISMEIVAKDPSVGQILLYSIAVIT